MVNPQSDSIAAPLTGAGVAYKLAEAVFALAGIDLPYDMLSLAVVDEGGQLLGAVSVDDVVDRMLGAGWRLRHRRQDGALDGVDVTATTADVTTGGDA